MKSEKEDFSDAQIEMIADVKSLDTQVEMRDNDLRSPNWFDAEKFPTLVFKSTFFTKSKNNKYKHKGNITIRGVSKPIEFDVTLNGWAVTLTKKQTAGFTVTDKLKRSDFGLGNVYMGRLVAEKGKIKLLREGLNLYSIMKLGE